MDGANTKYSPVSKSEVAWLGTDPIPAEVYYDPEYFELERKAVFMRSWILMGHVCELPKIGSFIRREVEFANTSLLIVRGKDDQIRAFHNVCPHRGTELVPETEGTKSTFSCRYHMWTFGTDGALVSAPDFQEFNLEKADCSLHSVRLEVAAGMLFINFSASASSLAEDFGEFGKQLETLAVARATHFSEYTYEMASNWKLGYDNFQENYHLRFIHPRSGGQGISPENPFGYPKSYRFQDSHRAEIIYFDREAQCKGPVQMEAIAKNFEFVTKKGLMASPNADDYFALFPNFFMLGTPFQNFSHVIYPLSPGRARGVIRLYWIGEPENASELFAREYSMQLLRDVQSEDVNVIESGFRGLSSGVLKHIHFQTQEVLCRHLYVSVSAKVEAYKAEMAAARGSA